MFFSSTCLSVSFLKPENLGADRDSYTVTEKDGLKEKNKRRDEGTGGRRGQQEWKGKQEEERKRVRLLSEEWKPWKTSQSVFHSDCRCRFWAEEGQRSSEEINLKWDEDPALFPRTDEADSRKSAMQSPGNLVTTLLKQL